MHAVAKGILYTHIISVIRLMFTTFEDVYAKIVLSSEGIKLKKITKKEIENKNISYDRKR